MVDKYEINDNTPTENITLEEEAANIPDEEPQGDRPEWLPEKFKSPEDLAQAYNNLESKLGSNTDSSEKEDLPPTEPSEESESSESQTSAIEAASTEFAENGELTDMTYDALAKAGLSREIVDSYIEGQQALQSSAETDLLDVVGGQESYSKISEWASEALTETQLDAYNKALEGTDAQAKLALDWLKGKYDEANGVNPNLIQGNTQGSSTKPFESRAQVLAAMSERDERGKKKYEVDPSYRATVERRLAVSNI
tara:strand:- start:718 stop:1479 length:762 start_codon:yes stop_codon:yes gene_type:complete